MPRLNQGRLSLLVGLISCFLLLLVGNHFTNRNGSTDVQTMPDNVAAVSPVLFDREVESPNVRVAIPFGNNAAHHLSHPEGTSPSRRPSRRVKRDVTLTWAQALANGQTQFGRLSGTRTEAQYLLLSDMVSPLDIPDGTSNGWTVSEQPNGQAPPDFIDAFDELDIPQGSANHYRVCHQDLAFKNCLYTGLPKTSATFSNYINVKGKTIVADVSWSPAAMVNELEIPPADWKQRLPNVKRMSDVVWIQWSTVANAEGTPSAVSELKYIFRHDIITENTRFIMEQAADTEEDKFNEDWPGLKFVATDTKFQALLGTVHGVSIVDLLVSHPNELGTKSIEAVNIFTTDDGSDYHMLWTLTGDGNPPIE